MKILFVVGVLLAGGQALASVKDSREVTFKNGAGQVVGTATITEVDKGISVALDLKNMSAGVHAIHVHENGSCVGPNFDSAGGHFNPSKKSHGFHSEKGPHAGDFDNITVGADGTLKAELSNDRLTLGKGKNSLRKPGGTAIIIHQKADDYKSQPSGDAGGREACAEIK